MQSYQRTARENWTQHESVENTSMESDARWDITKMNKKLSAHKQSRGTGKGPGGSGWPNGEKTSNSRNTRLSERESARAWG